MGPEPAVRSAPTIRAALTARGPRSRWKAARTFHFLDAAPAGALETAPEAADGQDGPDRRRPPPWSRDFLAARLVDHMHLVQVPIVLGRGVRIWDGLEALEDAYDVEAVSSPSGVTHLTFTRKVVVNADTEPQVVPGKPRLSNERPRTCSGKVARRGSSPTFPASRQPRRSISSSKRAFESSRKPSDHSPCHGLLQMLVVRGGQSAARTRLRQIAGVLRSMS